MKTSTISNQFFKIFLWTKILVIFNEIKMFKTLIHFFKLKITVLLKSYSNFKEVLIF